MGRGLSELQKAILKLSWDELEEHRKAKTEVNNDPKLLAEWLEYYVHGRGGPIPNNPALAVMAKDNWSGLIDTDDIFINFYGWVPKTNRFGRRYFSKSEIGPKLYMAAYIAVRKSLNRLMSRGLIDFSRGRYNGYSLSIKGRDLMAKPIQPTTQDTGNEPVKLRYLRDVVRDNDELMHPKGEIIEVDGDNAKRMMVCGLWEVVTTKPEPEPEVKGVEDTNAIVDKPIKRSSYKKRQEILKYVLAELQAGHELRISDVDAKFETPTARYDIWFPLGVNLNGGRIHNTKKDIKAIQDYIG